MIFNKELFDPQPKDVQYPTSIDVQLPTNLFDGTIVCLTVHILQIDC